jgi:hypothetical protein
LVGTKALPLRQHPAEYRMGFDPQCKQHLGSAAWCKSPHRAKSGGSRRKGYIFLANQAMMRL